MHALHSVQFGTFKAYTGTRYRVALQLGHDLRASKADPQPVMNWTTTPETQGYFADGADVTAILEQNQIQSVALITPAMLEAYRAAQGIDFTPITQDPPPLREHRAKA